MHNGSRDTIGTRTRHAMQYAIQEGAISGRAVIGE
jgi:hypothetical protein